MVGLDHRPDLTVTDQGNHGPGRFQKSATAHHARCIAVVFSDQGALVLSSMKVNLSATTIENILDGNTSIGQAAAKLIESNLGIHVSVDRLRLIGKVSLDIGIPSIYLVGHWADATALNRSDVVWLSGDMIGDLQSEVPPKLLKLFMAMGPKGELGYDVDGSLVVWNQAVARRVMGKATKGEDLIAA